VERDMREKMKKILLSVVITLFIFAISIKTNVSAETATTGKCGENAIWTFDSTTGTLTISGTGKMYDAKKK
jgi:hypothetical protein